MKTHLRSLSLQGFRSFVQKSSVEFPESGLVLIKGQDPASGVSSGTGKSSLNLAVSFGLGFCPFPATETSSWKWLNPPDTKVSLSFDKAGKEFTITKGDGARSLEVDGQETLTAAKAVAKGMEDLFSMGPTLLEAVTFRQQGSKGFFLLRTDLEKKHFLSEILELGPFEEAQETSQKLLVQHEASVAMLSRFVDEAIKQMDESRDRLTGSLALGQAPDTKAFTEEQKEIAESLQEISKSARETIDKVNGWEGSPKLVSLRERLDALSEQSRMVQKEYQGRKEEREKAYRLLDDKVRKLRPLGSEVPHLEKSIKNYLREKGILEHNKCPTCQQDWNNCEDQKLSINKSIKQAEERLSQAKEAVQNIAQLEFEQSNMPAVDVSEEQQRLIEEQQQAQAALEALVKDRDTKKRIRCNEVLQERDTLAGKHNQRLAEIQEVLSRIRNQESEQAKAKEAFSRAETLLAKRLAEKNTLSKSFNTEKDFSLLVGREGFLGDIFDEILLDISSKTNDILGSVANTQDITIRFVSESTTTKGLVNRSIKALISIDGNEIPLKSGLSGGMLTAVDLAVDLSIGSVISERKGSFPNWLILDESFNGLDPISKRTCIEILKKHSQDRLIIVIDHCPEFQGYFDQVIDIVYENKNSTIQKVTI